jgi:hypothetical protein
VATRRALVAPASAAPGWARAAGGGRLGVGPALRYYMRRVHALLLRRPAVKGAVVAAFVGLFLFSCATLPRLER